MTDWWPAAGRTKRAVLAAVIFAGIVILAPLVAMLGQHVSAVSAATTETFLDTTAMGRLGWLTLRSAVIAFGAATLAVVSGGGLAWVLTARPGLRFRSRELLLLPLVIPPYLVTLGWVAATDALAMSFGVRPGLSGPAWAIVILGLAAAPPVALVLEAILRRNLAAPFESALMTLGPSGALKTAIMPPLMRPAAAIWLFLFSQTLAEYGVLLYLQTPVLATELISAFAGGSPAGSVLRSAWPLGLLVACSVAAWGSLVSTEGSSHRAGAHPGRLFWLDGVHWPWWVRAGTSLGAVAAVAGCVVPVAGLALGAFRPGGGTGMLIAALPAVRMSVVLAAGCALIALVPALILGDALGAAARRYPLIASALALAIPAGCTGVAHAGFWTMSSFPGGGTAIWFGHLARILPPAWLVAAFLGGPHGRPAAVEAAMMLPGGFVRRSLLRLRLELPRVLAVAGVAFAVSIRELDVSLLTVPPGGETLPLRLFNLMHYGAGGDVCRLGLLLGVVLVTSTYIAGNFMLSPREKGV